ncbi:EEF1A lysine methyltransferase 3-like [Trichomycterus rosablanca]|uniref:EEF1A lysine methyltransferase 3-like n=1 Tax=Trichomycterus rosablanca TaxID=2290929 RepID=UPI002F35FC1C
MSGYFEEVRMEFWGKKVIELGAGSGFISILAARLGACVTVTDLPEVLPHTLRNVNSNTPGAGWPSGPPAVLPLVWGRDLERFCSHWDLVLGSDIVYLPETFPLLLDTLVVLCGGGGVLYLSSKMRREHETHEFYQTWLPQKFRVELVQRDSERNINVYRATLRSGESPSTR